MIADVSGKKLAKACALVGIMGVIIAAIHFRKMSLKENLPSNKNGQVTQVAKRIRLINSDATQGNYVSSLENDPDMVMAREAPTHKLPELIGELLSKPYSDKRQSAIWAACKRLGGDVGIEQALNIINDLAGPGQNHDWMLAAAVSGTSEKISDVITIIRNLEFKDDVDACMRGVSTLISSGSPDISELLSLSPFSPAEASAIVAGLSINQNTQYATFEHLSERTNDVVNLVLSTCEGDKANQMIGDYFRSMSYMTPQNSLKLMIKTMDELKSLSPDGANFTMVLQAAFRNDPQKAIETVQSSIADSGSIDSGRLIASSVSQWMKYDLNAALEWYSRCDSLTAEVKSYAALPFLEKALDAADLSVSRKWLDDIKDPELRRSTEARIWSKERDLLRSEVASNPAGTLQAFVADNSSYQDYWLEEAVATWATKEPEKVQEWYQKTWKSLPANKAQYVAAAFANQAVAQGDLTTAHQWAAYIQDPKTKQRIEAGIAKAEGQKAD